MQQILDWLFIVLVVFENFAAVRGFLSAELQPVGYNYGFELFVEGNAKLMMVDTGNGMIAMIADGTQNGVDPCLYLWEDGSYVAYLSQQAFNKLPYIVNGCKATNYTISIQDSHANALVTLAKNVTIDDVNLHNWYSADGDVGMAYPSCTASIECPFSAFQLLLENIVSTDKNQSGGHLIFGLDVYGSTAGNNNTMQLGGILQKYEDSVNWIPQATSQPEYHMFFMDDLTVCSQLLFGNYSSNWPAIVDTGSVCLSLPAEIYNALVSWLGDMSLSGPVDMTSLPVLSFTVDHQQLYLPLASLIIDSNLFTSGIVAPVLSVQGVLKQLCVIQGSSITNSDGSYSTPLISFGTMTLQHMYFAADFTSMSVAVVSKLSAEQGTLLQTMGDSSCAAPVICPGDQQYNAQSNSCNPPQCSSYYFTVLDNQTQQCQFNKSGVSFAIFLLVVIVICELATFLVVQTSAYEYLAAQAGPNEGTGFALSKVDLLTRLLGAFATRAVDYILIHILNWVVLRNRNLHPNQPQVPNQNGTRNDPEE